MALSYQLYQQPQDHLGMEVDRFWSVLFTVDSMRSYNMPMQQDDHGGAWQTNQQHPVVFVGGLHASFSEAHLVKLLSPFGKLARVQLIPGKGCAVCEFGEARAAEECVRRLHGRLLLGKELCVGPANLGSLGKRSLGEDTRNCMEIESPVRVIRRKLNEDSYFAY
jgi:RNA recognition motif-containing protein